MIKQKPFTKYRLKESDDVFTIRLNEEERKALEGYKKELNQPKDSTAYKQMALLGSNVLHHDFFMLGKNIVTENKRKNKRTGIIDYEV